MIFPTPPYETPMPKLVIKTTPGVSPLHELEGWEELDQWGYFNHPHWRELQDRLEWAEGMSEIDKLRLLAGHMLCLNVELMKKLIETTRWVSVPRILIPSDNTPS